MQHFDHMTQTLYHLSEPVTLLGAAPIDDRALDLATQVAPEVIAADGGANLAAERGLALKAIIGDLDSMVNAKNWQKSGTTVHHLTDQVSTDLEKCLYSVDAPLYLGVGFLSGLLDHTLAAMHALVAYPHRNLVLIGPHEICFLAPLELELDLPAGMRLSLFPLAEVSGTRSDGLVWPIDGLTLSPLTRIGTSNAVSERPVRIGIDRRALVVILPRAALGSVLAALGPARA
ncbi:thiamine diphosphokinase [Oceanomicrobium pacificus]|uniref:Thiamine diphosphokinase n=1 Tax=Oceanomicrobium pacificus TaxID=2692916 RepID=A0A6B0U3K0_9RHOB|nr:thiamine diphosphokinase [Oceanomicrobium pacificus]MXU65531.1 thiamine diphosphokinase [Oceanomicrobium pacificus]